MKALVAVSTLAVFSMQLSLNACFAEGGALQKLPVVTAEIPVHSKAWLEEKLKQVNSLLEKDSANPKILAGRAQIYYELKDYDNAISDISKAISLNSAVQEYFHLRAVAEWAKKDMKQAISDMSRAIDIGPPRAELFSKRGSYSLVMRQFAAASDDARKSLQLRPNDYATLVLIGASEHNQNHYQLALNWYSKAISVSPKNGDTYALRSGVYKLMGNNDAAKKDQDMARKLGSAL